MRSTFAGLNTMVRGIYSNQLSLDTTGHNITNASTEGYSRQSVNLAATRGQQVSSIYGQVMVGTGVDSTSIERARNVYADKQYWSETAQQQYYKTQQTNYDKVEAIFNDSGNTGIKNAVTEFYNAWNDLSTSASTASTLLSPAISSLMGSVRTSLSVRSSGRLPSSTGWMVTIFFVRPLASWTVTSVTDGTTFTSCTSRPSALSAVRGTCRSKSVLLPESPT